MRRSHGFSSADSATITERNREAFCAEQGKESSKIVWNRTKTAPPSQFVIGPMSDVERAWLGAFDFNQRRPEIAEWLECDTGTLRHADRRDKRTNVTVKRTVKRVKR